MQRTGRSKHTVNLSGVVTIVEGYWLESSLVVDKEDNIVFPIANPISALIKLNKNLITDSLAIFEKISEIHTTPVILDSNNILVGTGRNELIKITNTGNVIWSFQAGTKIFNSGIAVGLNGDMYFIDADGILYALGKNGELKWKIQGYNFSGLSSQAIALSPNSEILYFNGLGPSLFAVDANSKSVLWEYGTGKQFSSPLVDNEGNVYQYINSTRKLISFQPNGNIKWQVDFSNRFSHTVTLTMDTNGNVYFATDSLYSISYEGERRWTVPLNGQAGNIICDNSDQLLLILGIDSFIKPVIYSSKGILIREVTTNLDILNGWPDIVTHDSWIIPVFHEQELLIIK